MGKRQTAPYRSGASEDWRRIRIDLARPRAQRHGRTDRGRRSRRQRRLPHHAPEQGLLARAGIHEGGSRAATTTGSPTGSCRISRTGRCTSTGGPTASAANPSTRSSFHPSCSNKWRPSMSPGRARSRPSTRCAMTARRCLPSSTRAPSIFIPGSPARAAWILPTGQSSTWTPRRRRSAA